jgi:hypothetical protein
MKRWDSQSGSKRRGRGRRRTVPLRPFDTVPSELVEAAKGIFAQSRVDVRGGGGSPMPEEAPDGEDHPSLLSVEALVLKPLDWRRSWYLLNFAW